MNTILCIGVTWVSALVLFHNGYYDHLVRERYVNMVVEELVSGDVNSTKNDWEAISEKYHKLKKQTNE